MAGSPVQGLGPGERHKLVHVAVGSTEVLPGGAELAQELDTRRAQLRDRLGQIRDLEANHRASRKMLFARVVPTEHFHVLPIGKFEHPEVRL